MLDLSENDEMTYELVLDNSKMLANCFEAVPCTPAVINPTGSLINMGDPNSPTLTGSGNILGDSSDATYGDWPDAAGTINTALETATINNSLFLHLRMTVLTADPTGFGGHGEVFLSTDSAGFDEICGFSDGTTSGYGFIIPNSAAFGTVEIVKSIQLGPWGGTTFDDVAALLATGAYMNFNAFIWEEGSEPPTFRVFKAWLESPCP